MLIPFVWLNVFKCDVYTQVLIDQTQKDFWVFYMFLKVFLCFCVFKVFVHIAYFLFLLKTLSETFSRESRELALPAKMRMAKIGKHWILDRNFHDYFVRKIYPWNSLHASVAFSRVISREAYPQKLRVFSFKRQTMKIFQTYLFCLLRVSLNPKLFFSQKPNKISSLITSKTSLRYVSTFFYLWFLSLSVKF